MQESAWATSEDNLHDVHRPERSSIARQSEGNTDDVDPDLEPYPWTSEEHAGLLHAHVEIGAPEKDTQRSSLTYSYR